MQHLHATASSVRLPLERAHGAQSTDENYRVSADPGPWLVMLAPFSLALTLAFVCYVSKLSF